MPRILAAPVCLVGVLLLTGCPDTVEDPTSACDTLDPCFEGVACTDDASGGYTCGDCPDGYDGDGVTCEDIDGCAGDPCFADVACTDAPAPGTGFTCGDCPDGYDGDGVTCEDVDGCAGDPCFADVACTDVPAPGTGFTCGECPDGYVGDGVTCEDVDGCAGDPCFADVACTDVPAPGTGFTCGECPDGYVGDGVACEDVDGCAGAPCFPGVTCFDVAAPGTGFTCDACPSGLEGDGVTCTEIDGCAGEPCLVGSTCTDVPAPGTGFTCSPCTADCPTLRALAGGDETVLAGTVVTLEGDAVGFNGAFSCAWTNDHDAARLTTCTATATVLTDTIFTLTVTDASGLSATDDKRVFTLPLVADAGPDTNIAYGETATLAASWQGESCSNSTCIACQWATSDGTPVADTCTATVTPTATTQYFLTVLDTGTGETARDSATVFITDTPAQLCGWNVAVIRQTSYPTGGNPNYLCDSSGTARVQTVNGKPAIVRSDLVVRNARIVGNIGVQTTGDDDLIGFLWGLQDATHFYLLNWKQLNQNYGACGAGRAGIAVKKVDLSTTTPDTFSFEPAFGFDATDYAYDCTLTWSGARADEPAHDPGVTFLTSPDDADGFRTGWADNVFYRFEFFYTPTRTKIFVYEDDLMSGTPDPLVHEFVIVDSSFPSGSFAFFSNSQAQVAFGDFTLASLDDFAADAGPDLTKTGTATVSLHGSATLAVPPILCEWSAGGSLVGSTCDLDVAPATTTTYELMVTDDFGRVRLDDTTVTVTP